jgi:hypothetical protein
MGNLQKAFLSKMLGDKQWTTHMEGMIWPMHLAHIYWFSHIFILFCYTLWLFNIATENGPFIEDLWWFTYPKWWFSIATLKNQTVCLNRFMWTCISIPLFTRDWATHDNIDQTGPQSSQTFSQHRQSTRLVFFFKKNKLGKQTAGCWHQPLSKIWVLEDHHHHPK